MQRLHNCSDVYTEIVAVVHMTNDDAIRRFPVPAIPINVTRSLALVL